MKIHMTCLIVALTFVFQIEAQTLNLEINNENDQPFLLGKIDKSGLTSEHYNSWFSKNYEDYDVDQTTIEALKPILKDYQITLFMGTWCGDSKQEVPRFYKILEACNFPEDQLTVIALSSKPYMYKQSPNHEEAGLNIHRVPTFIFYKNRKEVNRIVEHPVKTLEEDMLNIVTKNDYKSNYQIVSKIHLILKEDGLNGLKKQSRKLIKTFNAKVSSMFELNTYGRILYANNNIAEAIEVFKLNTKLFPNEPRTYMSLANTLGVYSHTEEAIQTIEKAMQLFPDNDDLVKNLEALKTR
ncbi:thioredoxin family protein [Psychroserpens sp. SPM9]|uniref:thioredoxin family protein n=1 Tax=Psychroserpens sp. SPM9 TaxID=2975598 RepID=UPI0021A4C836|nr:thioredoxin family protein [Psychroserpens sp. SPM9]MDG5489931.1 thioredoxin family protein [Psychroserpens sp. SPM9]